MWLFKNKKKKEERNVMKRANNIVQEMILKKALEENKAKELQLREREKAIVIALVIALENAEELRKSNTNLENNLGVLQATIEKIREICNNSDGNVISKNKILKEIGE